MDGSTADRIRNGGVDLIYSRNIAVDDLNHDQSAVVGHDVKGLCLHIGVLVRLPSQHVLVEDSVGGLCSLLGDRSDRLGAVDRFLRAHRSRETVIWISLTPTNTSATSKSGI